MNRLLLTIAKIAAFCLPFTLVQAEEGAAPAQSVTPRPAAIADPAGAVVFSGLVDVGFTHNFSDPRKVAFDTNDNVVRSFDRTDDSFAIALAQLTVARAAETLGFKLKLDFFETAKVIDASNTGAGDDIAIQEANVSYKLGVGNGITFAAGKSVTLLGYEPIEATGRWAISRGLLATGGAPFTSVGLRGKYDLLDNLTLTLGVNNGEDADLDLNKGKSLEGMLEFQPLESLQLQAKLTYGPELPANEGDKQWIADLVAAYDVSETLQGWVEFLYGSTEQVDIGGGLTEDADFWSVAVSGLYRVTDKIGVSGRFEYFDDEHTQRFAPGISRTFGLPDGTFDNLYLWEATVTGHYWLTESLEVRVEYRHDAANLQIFHGGNTDGLDDGQQTIAAQILYKF